MCTTVRLLEQTFGGVEKVILYVGVVLYGPPKNLNWVPAQSKSRRDEQMLHHCFLLFFLSLLLEFCYNRHKNKPFYNHELSHN